MRRRPIIGVMGSGSESTPLTEEVGRLIARRKAHLLTGGGGGQMEAVSRGFCQTPEREGLCLGVLPCRDEDQWTPPPGYPNPYVEIPIQTHLWLSGTQGEHIASRNPINVLSSDAVIVLHGQAGTISEARLAQRAGRPIALFLPPQLLVKAKEQIEALDLEPWTELSLLDAWFNEVLMPSP